MTDWAKILGLRGGVQVRAGNRVDSLIDGPATYQAMYDAIRTTFQKGASFYIYLLAWWLDDDFPLVSTDKDSTFFRLVQKASTEYGVQVRIMVWANPLAGAPGIVLDAVKAALTNAIPAPPAQLMQIARYQALPAAAAILDAQQPSRFQAHHQKVLLVKGSQGLVGFCGGLDIAEDRVRHVALHTGSPFHDVHCRIAGDATRDLLDVFVQRWQTHPSSGDLDASKGTLRGIADLAPISGQKPAGEQSVGIARTFNVQDGNTWYATELSVAAIFAYAILAARRFIYIEDQYLVNLQAAALLREALPRIQHLTIVIPDSVELPLCSIIQQQFHDLLTEGDARLAKKVRVFHRKSGDHSYVHAKTWIIDDELAIIGSANCNRRGWNGDSEVAAAIFDKPASVKSPPFAQTLRMRLWAEHTGVAPGDLYDGTNVKPWELAAKLGNVRPYQHEYPVLDQAKDQAVLAYTRMSPAEVWNTISDPMPKPFPLAPRPENRRAKR